MAKLTLGQKADRVLDFLMGLRNRHIVVQLKPYGFGLAQLNEGWDLLRAVGKGRLDLDPVEPAYDAESLRQLDQWENKWFAISSAALTRHLPDAQKWFFKNLSQTEGPAVIVSVGTFLERWDLLDQPKDKGGPPSGGKAAKKLLTERGLTSAVLDQARDLLKKLGAVNGPLPDVDADAQAEAELEKAEKAMWAWYLEWSQVARTAITRRQYLRQLGFLRGRAGGAGGDGGEDEDVMEEDGAEAGDGAEDAPEGIGPGEPGGKKAPKPA